MANTEDQHEPISLFYSYSHKDEALLGQIIEQLTVLRRKGLIADWHDRLIGPGDDWKGEIDQHLKMADVILLLVSPSFIASDYIWDVEMRLALDRHARGEARVVPVILRPCLWFDTPMAALQAVPKDAVPVTEWPNTDQALYDVATRIRNLVVTKKQDWGSLEELPKRNENKRLSKITHGMLSAKSSWDLKKILHQVDELLAESPNSSQARLLKETIELSARNALRAEAFETDPMARRVLPQLESRLLYARSTSEFSQDIVSFNSSLNEYPRSNALDLFQSFISNPLFGLPDLAVFRDVDESWCPEMVIVPAGSFLMGSPQDEEPRREHEGPQHEGPQHEVTFRYRFAIGRYPVNFEEYDHFCEATQTKKPSDEGWGRGRRPVINVSWDDAQAYTGWLTKETGKTYRLPREAEWEYCCRAGTTTRYSCGNEITEKDANFRFNIVKTTEVGSYPPNLWGLYDMHGNVWEWVEDCWHSNYEGAPTDGRAWLATNGRDLVPRVLRGGSWLNLQDFARSAVRLRDYPDSRNNLVGFRVVCSAPSSDTDH